MLNSDLRLSPIDYRPGRWQLLESIRYLVPFPVVRTAPGPSEIIVHAGFETDLASIPRLFWPILPPFGRYAAAAVVHDYLYQAHEGSRTHADLVFLAAMRELGVATWKRAVLYQAVRLFGHWRWQRAPLIGGIQ